MGRTGQYSLLPNPVGNLWPNQVGLFGWVEGIKQEMAPTNPPCKISKRGHDPPEQVMQFVCSLESLLLRLSREMQRQVGERGKENRSAEAFLSSFGERENTQNVVTCKVVFVVESEPYDRIVSPQERSQDNDDRELHGTANDAESQMKASCVFDSEELEKDRLLKFSSLERANFLILPQN